MVLTDYSDITKNILQKLLLEQSSM